MGSNESETLQSYKNKTVKFIKPLIYTYEWYKLYHITQPFYILMWFKDRFFRDARTWFQKIECVISFILPELRVKMNRAERFESMTTSMPNGYTKFG